MRRLAFVALLAGCHHDPPQYVAFDAPPRPIDVAIDAARSCTRDSECASGACAEQFGACTASASTLFVTLTGADTGDCRASACATIAYALTQITAGTTPHTIALGLGIHEVTAALDVSGKDVRLSGPGPAHFPNFPLPDPMMPAAPLELAILRGSAGHATIKGDGGTLALENLALTGAPVTHDAIDVTDTSLALFDLVAGGNGRSVLKATSDTAPLRGEGLLFANDTLVDAPALDLDQEATFLRVIIGNSEPAFSVSKTLRVQNAVIGGMPTAFVTAAGAEGSIVDYATLLPSANIKTGPVSVAISSSIVASAATTTGATYTFTMFPAGTPPGQIPGTAGDENFAGAPAFVDPNPAGGIDLHLLPTSDAIGRANTATSTSIDLDNAARPFPFSTRADCGAYEERTITPTP